MPEPEPFTGWGELRTRLLAFLEEGRPASDDAVGFVERCPAVEGQLDLTAGRLSLTFACSRGDFEYLMGEYRDLYEELESALEAVLAPRRAIVSLDAVYAPPTELAQWRPTLDGPRALTAPADSE